jgi:hypothetical protein
MHPKSCFPIPKSNQQIQGRAEQAFSQGPKRGRPILVQRYIYSKGRGGGGVGKTFLWKTFEVYVTSCQYLFQPRSKFFKHTWLCEFVPLCFFTYNYDIFIQPGTPSNWSKCQLYNNNKLFRFRYINILREIIENNFPFPPEFGRPKASIFCSRGVSGRLDALLAKSLVPSDIPFLSGPRGQWGHVPPHFC